MSQPRRKGDGDVDKVRKTAMDIPPLKAHLLSKLHKSETVEAQRSRLILLHNS